MEKENKNILDLILGLDSDENYKSTLQLALKQARHLAGSEDGTVSHTSWICRRLNYNNSLEELTDSFLVSSFDEDMDVLTSLSLYLIILDQLGHIFGEQNTRSNRIDDAIKKSGVGENLSKKDIKAIKNLRNSINHNFGLASYNPGKGEIVMKYELCIGSDDGNKSPCVFIKKDRSEIIEKITFIYPFSLMNFVESVLKSFIKMYRNKKIQSPLSDEVLKTRFTILNTK